MKRNRRRNNKRRRSSGNNGSYFVKRRRRVGNLFPIIAIIFAVLLIGFVAIFSINCISNNINSSKNKKGDSTKEVSDSIKNSAGQIEEQLVDEEEVIEEDNGLPMAFPEKKAGYEEITDPEIGAPNVAVVNFTDNFLVAGRNADVRIYPASMTKVMTLIVAVENIDDLNTKFTMTNEIIDPLYKEQASRAGFVGGEQVTAKDLLYGLILPSGADSAVGLAMLVSGSEQEFVNLMNEKCVEMGLKNTHFTNTSGLFNENHYTTPVEQAMIMSYAMQNETCAEILSTYQYTTEKTEQNPEGILLTSTMFSRMYGDEVPGVLIKGGKTGYTQEALQCLVSYAESDGKEYAVVTTGASSKWDCIYDHFDLYGKYCEGAIKAAAEGETSPHSENATQSQNAAAVQDETDVNN